MVPEDQSPTRTLSPVSPLREEEVDAFFEVDAAAFGARMSKGMEELIRSVMSVERIAASRDEGAVVGTAASESTAMTVPGFARVPTAMIVAVAVLPSHRRQGRLRSLMRYQLDDLHTRGEAAACLYASEGGIYGRFGYGQATFGSTYILDKRVARLHASLDGRSPGRVRLVRREEAAEAFPAIYKEYAPTRAGEIDRSVIDYASALGEPGGDDLSRRFYAVYEEDGQLDAYAGYEVADKEGPPHHGRRVVLHELCALTPAGYAAMWDFLLGIDLTDELRAPGRPIDEPLKWMLAEPRQLRCTFSGDRTWVRLVDAPACLRGRRYATEGDLVLGLRDDFCHWNAGSYRLVVAEDWGLAEVEVTQRQPDVEIDASGLSSLYLGGVPAVSLAEAGRIRQLTAGAVPTLGRMFANDRPPYCLTPF